MKVLIACEESQRVCSAFRSKGHDAFSCDIQECSGGHPEWHIKGDCLPLLNGNCKFETQNGERHSLEGKWDLIIAHPPCTYLTVTANRWFDTGKYGESAWKRMTERNKAIAFFYRFVMADCEKIAIENPMGVISTAYRKADQIIQPYMFGDPFEKRTCLWLKGLPKLEETNRVDPPPRRQFKSSNSMPEWYTKLASLPKEERSKERSKTFPGIASAMAEQWGAKIKKDGENEMTNTMKLRAAITENGLNQEQVAKMLGLSLNTFNYKVNNRNEFKASEIKKLIVLLHLSCGDVMKIFFTDEVE